MKKLTAIFIACICMMAVSAAAQSVADAARQNRANKKANPSATVIDNDVIPSIIGKSTPVETASAKAPAAEPQAKNAATDTAKEDAKDQDKQDKKDVVEDSKKATADAGKATESLKKQIADQKREIAQLQREMDVSEREARLRAAAYYADAGVMLRDQERFAQESRKEQAEMNAKKQTLADAKQKLDELQEQARKAGISSNQLD